MLNGSGLTAVPIEQFQAIALAVFDDAIMSPIRSAGKQKALFFQESDGQIAVRDRGIFCPFAIIGYIGHYGPWAHGVPLIGFAFPSRLGHGLDRLFKLRAHIGTDGKRMGCSSSQSTGLCSYNAPSPRRNTCCTTALPFPGDQSPKKNHQHPVPPF